VNRAEFDRFADEYQALHRRSIALSGESPEYFAEYKIVDLKRVVGERGAIGCFLDVGAGIGAAVPFFRKHFPAAQLICADVSLRSLAIGRARFADGAGFVAFDGFRLPFPEGAFDGVFASCVLHHVVRRDRAGLLAELRRVLKPDGLVVVHEHNPRNPLTVRAVRACAFDCNAELLGAAELRATLTAAGFRQLATEYRVFFPRPLRALRRLERALAWLPLGAQYFVRGRR
jgi:ubiquinone/menaquinone biosynthesis C-methylase UbiE